MARTKHQQLNRTRFVDLPPGKAIKSGNRITPQELTSYKKLSLPQQTLRNSPQALSRASSNSTLHLSDIKKPDRRKNQPKKASARSSIFKPVGPVEMKNSSRFLQYSIPKRSFQRIIRSIAYSTMEGCRFTSEALQALQTAAEDYIVGFLEDAGKCMRHANRKTLMEKDMKMVAQLRKIEYETL